MNDNRMSLLSAALRLNTRLFLNCLEDVDDEASRIRPTHQINSMAYIALHMHDARHYLAKYLGVDEPDPFEQITSNANGPEGIPVYPSVAEARTAWMEVSLALDRRFAELTAQDLDSPSPEQDYEFPTEDKTVLGGISFLLHHESYHLGQLGMLRKLLNLPAMSWLEVIAEARHPTAMNRAPISIRMP